MIKIINEYLNKKTYIYGPGRPFKALKQRDTSSMMTGVGT